MSTIYLNRLHNKLDTTSVELIVQMALLEPIRKSSEDLVLHVRLLARSRHQVDGIQMVKITLKVERIEFAMHGNESHIPS